MDNTSMIYKALTVGELIDVLKKYNPEDKIATIRYIGFSKHVLPIVEKSVEYNERNNTVEIDVTI